MSFSDLIPTLFEIFYPILNNHFRQGRIYRSSRESWSEEAGNYALTWLTPKRLLRSSPRGNASRAKTNTDLLVSRSPAQEVCTCVVCSSDKDNSELVGLEFEGPLQQLVILSLKGAEVYILRACDGPLNELFFFLLR